MLHPAHVHPGRKHVIGPTGACTSSSCQLKVANMSGAPLLPEFCAWISSEPVSFRRHEKSRSIVATRIEKVADPLRATKRRITTHIGNDQVRHRLALECNIDLEAVDADGFKHARLMGIAVLQARELRNSLTMLSAVEKAQEAYWRLEGVESCHLWLFKIKKVKELPQDQVFALKEFSVRRVGRGAFSAVEHGGQRVMLDALRLRSHKHVFFF